MVEKQWSQSVAGSAVEKKGVSGVASAVIFQGMTPCCLQLVSVFQHGITTYLGPLDKSFVSCVGQRPPLSQLRIGDQLVGETLDPSCRSLRAKRVASDSFGCR